MAKTKEEQHKYHMLNRDQRNKKSKEYYQLHKEKQKAYGRIYGVKYNKEHKEERSLYSRKYREDNKEKLRLYYKNRHNENKEKRNQQCRDYQKKNLAKFRTYGHRRRAMEVKASGYSYTDHKHIQWRWEMFGNKCWICGTIATETDHVKPLSKGGSHWPSNLRPICRRCNSTKRNKWNGVIKTEE